MNRGALPEFHPRTLLRDWKRGNGFYLSDALTGVCIFGATGSGKTSGPGKHLAHAYLAAGFGGLVMCAKGSEATMWRDWIEATGRSQDLIMVDSLGTYRFNFLDWEASRPGRGFTMNIVALLEEIAGAITGSAGKAEGDNKFWEDALRQLQFNLVDLPVIAGLRVSLPLLRSIINSAPLSLEQAQDTDWQENSTCYLTLREAGNVVENADGDTIADYEECRNYWLIEFPSLSDRTRSIITLCFSILIRPFLTRPLRKLFSSDTNITPEAAFEGKLFVIDLPVQDFRLAGRMANLVYKYCFQVAILRRVGSPDSPYLRPCFIWGDEAQTFISKFDTTYQAVARSAGGCTVYMTQTREALRHVLGNDDAVEALLANLQCKIFCQGVGGTNKWASELLGQRWLDIVRTSVNSRPEERPGITNSAGAGFSRQEERRLYVEESTFTTLKRGGEKYGYKVEAIVYNGGHQYAGPAGELLPYTLLTFDQR